MVENWGEGADRSFPAEVLVVGHSFVCRVFQHGDSHKEACAPLTHDVIFHIGMGDATLAQILDKAMEALSVLSCCPLDYYSWGENKIDQDRSVFPPVDYNQVLSTIEMAVNTFVRDLPGGCKVMLVDSAHRFRWTMEDGEQGEGHFQYLERQSKLISIFRKVREDNPEKVIKPKRCRDISNLKSFGPDGVHLNNFSLHYYCH